MGGRCTEGTVIERLRPLEIQRGGLPDSLGQTSLRFFAPIRRISYEFLYDNLLKVGLRLEYNTGEKKEWY